MFQVQKQVLAQFDKLYAVAAGQAGGARWYYAAGEGRGGPCVAVCPQTGERRTLWPDAGGTMTLCPQAGGAVLAVQGFWPVFDAVHAQLVWAQPGPGGDYRVTPCCPFPYLHRFEVLRLAWGNALVAATLCGGKRDVQDWSQPGAVYAATLDGPGSVPRGLRPVLAGLTKNHGFWAGRFNGRQAVLVSASEGVFALYPPEQPEGEWQVEQLLDREVSDIAVYDLDGDGQDELAAIEGFHGGQVTLNKCVGGAWQTVWAREAPFGHALWCGLVAGRPCLLAGYRRGDQRLVLECFSRGLNSPQEQVLGAGGPSQLWVCPTPGGAQVLCAEREAGRAVLYELFL